MTNWAVLGWAASVHVQSHFYEWPQIQKANNNNKMLYYCHSRGHSVTSAVSQQKLQDTACIQQRWCYCTPAELSGNKKPKNRTGSQARGLKHEHLKQKDVMSEHLYFPPFPPRLLVSAGATQVFMLTRLLSYYPLSANRCVNSEGRRQVRH